MDLLKGLFQRPAVRPPTTGGRLVYAVGDVHGHRDLLRRMLDAITDDFQRSAAVDRPLLVLLGDYIDRGPDSAGVLDEVIALRSGPFEVRALKGNHEQQMLTFLSDASVGGPWASFGGRETLACYGIKLPRLQPTPEQWEAMRLALAEALPADHLQLLESLELTTECGDYLFVHAGLRPGVPIMDQSEDDLLRIRDDFLSSRKPFEKTVVHGHTPQVQPTLGSIRVGVDTGAYATGKLTAVRLFDEEQRIIQVTSAVAASAAS